MTSDAPSGPRISRSNKTPAVTSFTHGKFNFAIHDVKEVPATITGLGAHPYPFPEWWPKMKDKQEIFLPFSWWCAPLEDGGRGLKREDCAKTGYLKQRVNTLFTAWKTKVGTEKAGKRALVLVLRKEGDTNDRGERYEEPGLSMFMLNPAK